MSCPNSTESGCRCPLHHPGLLAYVAPERREALLNVLTGFQEPRLRLVEPAVDPCAGTMTCGCGECRKDRAARLKPRVVPRQPWEPAKKAA